MLGAGGDDSNGPTARSTRAPSPPVPFTATDEAIQANVVGAGYRQVGRPPSRPPRSVYTITNVNSGTAVPARQLRDRQRHRTQLWTAGATGCQKWTFTSVGNGHYIVTSVNSSTVLDSVNCGILDGTLTDLWASLGNSCQEWDVTLVGGHYTISNVGQRHGP